jgi:hypothetical protein
MRPFSSHPPRQFVKPARRSAAVVDYARTRRSPKTPLTPGLLRSYQFHTGSSSRKATCCLTRLDGLGLVRKRGGQCARSRFLRVGIDFQTNLPEGESAE